MKPISNIVYYNYMFILDLQKNIYKTNQKTYYMLAGSAGQHVVGFWDLNIDIFLEVQDKRYS